MKAGIVRSIELRISSTSKEVVNHRYEEKVSELSRDLASDFQKSLYEALIESFKAHIYADTDSRKDFMGFGSNETTSINYDVHVAMDMDAAVDYLLERSMICANKKDGKK